MASLQNHQHYSLVKKSPHFNENVPPLHPPPPSTKNPIWIRNILKKNILIHFPLARLESTGKSHPVWTLFTSLAGLSSLPIIVF